jgi:hypothetical protein
VNKKSKIFLSPISSSTLGKRTETLYEEAWYFNKYTNIKIFN